MDRKDGRDAAIAGGDLFERQRIADMVGSRPAVFGRHQHAHKAELAELGERLFWEFPLAIPVRRVWREQVLRDVARRIAQEDLLFGQPHSTTRKPRSGAT